MGKLIVSKGFIKLPKVQKSPNLVTLVDVKLVALELEVFSFQNNVLKSADFFNH